MLPNGQIIPGMGQFGHPGFGHGQGHSHPPSGTANGHPSQNGHGHSHNNHNNTNNSLNHQSSPAHLRLQQSPSPAGSNGHQNSGASNPGGSSKLTNSIVDSRTEIVSTKTGVATRISEELTCKNTGLFVLECSQPGCKAQFLSSTKRTFQNRLKDLRAGSGD